MFLVDNIGNSVSATSIGNTLVSESLLENGSRKAKLATQFFQTYIQALTESFIFYKIKRLDTKGKEYLKTLGKDYIVDIGLRDYHPEFLDGANGHILENIIYFELLRRGYGGAIGKLDNKEVDFIVTKIDEKVYSGNGIHECPRNPGVGTIPLWKIPDNYEKSSSPWNVTCPRIRLEFKLSEQ